MLLYCFNRNTSGWKSFCGWQNAWVFFLIQTRTHAHTHTHSLFKTPTGSDGLVPRFHPPHPARKFVQEDVQLIWVPLSKYLRWTNSTISPLWLYNFGRLLECLEAFAVSIEKKAGFNNNVKVLFSLYIFKWKCSINSNIHIPVTFSKLRIFRRCYWLSSIVSWA